jgi:hypothetical protein
MAGGGLGNLTVFLGLDAAEFETGISKAKLQAQRMGDAIGTAIGKGVLAATAGFGALVAAGGTAFAYLNKQAESIANYQDIADKIGTTADQVTKLQLAADLSGTALEAITSSSVKLTSALAKSDDEAKGAAAALAAIGLNAKDFKQLDPVAQYQTAAKALDGFRDGAEKTAIATALYGKSGAELLPFLKDLAEQGDQQVRLTEDQIAAADEYSKRIARQKSEFGALASIVAAESIPALEALTGAVKDSVAEFLGLDKGTKTLKDSTAIRDFATSAVEALGYVIDAGDGIIRVVEGIGKTLGAGAAQAAAVAKGEFSQALAIGEQWSADMAALIDKPMFSAALKKRLANIGLPKPDAPDQKPRIDTSGLLIRGKSGSADDPLKKQLENQVKLIQNAQKAEEELFKDRNKILELYNGENLISFGDYYGARRAAAEESLRNQSALIDQEVAKLQAYQAAAAKATDREAAQGKINDLIEKKAKLQRDAGIEGITLAFNEAKAYRDLQKQIDNVRASILDLSGQGGAAAALKFDGANEELRKRLGVQGDPVAVMQLDRLRELTVAQANYNDSAEQAAQIQARLQIAEQRITTAQQLGTTSEFSALQQLGDVRQKAVQQLEAIVSAQERVAAASGNDKLVLQAEQARAALDRLGATANPVADKLNGIFESSFGNAFADFITGAKSASDAFKAFGQSVIQQLANIAAQSVAKSIFGGLSGLGSLGGLASLFGGAGNAGFGDYSAAGLAAAFGGGRAVGGDVAPGKFYEVNERGPELYQTGGRQYLMAGGRGGRITPLGGGAGGGDGMAFTMINHSGVPLDIVRTERISPTEHRMIVDDARRQSVAQMRAELRDPASKSGRSLNSTFKLQRNMA